MLAARQDFRTVATLHVVLEAASAFQKWLRMESAALRARANVDWIGLGVKLGGIVALFAAVAAFTMLMLATGPRSDTALLRVQNLTHQPAATRTAAVVPQS